MKRLLLILALAATTACEVDHEAIRAERKAHNSQVELVLYSADGSERGRWKAAYCNSKEDGRVVEGYRTVGANVTVTVPEGSYVTCNPTE